MTAPYTTLAPPPPPPRHALGLPAGSVRALLALGALGIAWGMAVGAKHEQKMPLAFLYLQFLLMLIVAHFFAAHGSTIGKNVSPRSPLGFPRGSIRCILLGGYLALAWYLYQEQADLSFETPAKADLILFLALILTGFFAGHVLTLLVRFFSGGTLPFWFQDILAWVALLSMIGLGTVLLIHFINSNISPNLRFGTSLDVGLATLVSFYFGARS